MSDADYKAVSMMRCPQCDSDENARTNYSASVDGRIGIDVTCDSCGASWTSYEGTVDLPRVDQLKMDVEYAPVEIDPPTSHDITAVHLMPLTDNVIRRMKKGELLSMAIDLDIDDCTKMSKLTLVEKLIEFRECLISNWMETHDIDGVNL